MKNFEKWLLGTATACVLILAFGMIVPKHTNPVETVTTTTYVKSDNTPLSTPTDYQTTRNPVKTKVVYNLNLKSDNTVLLLGEIGANSLSVAQELQQKTKYNKEVFLLISSPGGSVLDGLTIVTVLQNSKVPIHTVCFMACASMASIIFEAGKTRFMVGNSILMFHSASGGFSGPFNQIQTRFTFFNNIVKKLDTDIANRVGWNPQKFIDAMPNELWFFTDDAIAQNFADKLASVSLDITNQDRTMVNRLSNYQPLKEYNITVNAK